MAFQSITEKIIIHIHEGERLKIDLEYSNGNSNNFLMYQNVDRYFDKIRDLDFRFETKLESWISNVSNTLMANEEQLASLKIKNIYTSYRNSTGKQSVNCLSLITDIINELLAVSAKIENSKSHKSLKIITIDDIDNFKLLLSYVDDSKIESKFFESAFLEDDVENAFLEILNEPYKENDSGSEMRDLYTNNIKIDGKRIQSVVMFKGRGVKNRLNISDCGKNGNQLLKLAKNTTARLYVIQHVNKIDPEVIETLKHHLLAYSQEDSIIICPIDGKDTARILKSINRDLESLMSKTRGT